MPSDNSKTLSADKEFAIIGSRNSSKPKPFAKTRSASAIFATSSGVGLNPCGSTPTGSNTSRSIASPPTCATTSPTIVVVANTFNLFPSALLLSLFSEAAGSCISAC